jgi:hypothetical protein
MRCQLRVLPVAGTTRLERLLMGLCYTGCYLVGTSRRVWNDPSLVLRKVRRVLGVSRPGAASKTHDPTGLPVGLQPGDQVRVKPLAEIRATLDSHGRYEGMFYTSATMDRYCGGTYTVVTRVDRFFDERSRRMLKLKNTVLLDRVYCQPAPDLNDRIAGCKRTCFLFWKEAWLERVGPGANAAQ